MRTIGFDFGTHQTKICVEEKTRMETNYHFLHFIDNEGNDNLTLPSIIKIKDNGQLSYGFVPANEPGEIIRYFKQATFIGKNKIWKHHINPEFFTVWYLAYILFKIEDHYGTDFAVNFGIPTDTSKLPRLKKQAVQLLCAAYELVEDTYKNNRKAFLAETIDTLLIKTHIRSYSEDSKEGYAIMVFPEAYACLRPLAAKGKIVDGLNLMVDIGGGTTDISFFTMEKAKESDKFKTPQIYKLMSLPLGLNFLTAAEERLDSGDITANVNSSDQILNDRFKEYKHKIELECASLRTELMRLFSLSTLLDADKLSSALRNRPIIYTGGGSVFKSLRAKYAAFSDVIHISSDMFDEKSLSELRFKPQYYPVLSTAFGLCLNAKDDDISTKRMELIFAHLSQYTEDDSNPASIVTITHQHRKLPSAPIRKPIPHVTAKKSANKEIKLRYSYKIQIENLMLSWGNQGTEISDKKINETLALIDNEKLKKYFLGKVEELKQRRVKDAGDSYSAQASSQNVSSVKRVMTRQDVDEFVETISVRDVLAIDRFKEKLTYDLRDYLARKIEEKKNKPKTTLVRDLHLLRSTTSRRRAVPKVEAQPTPRHAESPKKVQQTQKKKNTITTYTEVDNLIKSWLSCNGTLSEKAIKRASRKILSPAILSYFERKIAEVRNKGRRTSTNSNCEAVPRYADTSDAVIYKNNNARKPLYGYARDRYGRVQKRDLYGEDHDVNPYNTSNSLYDIEDDSASSYDGWE